MSSFSISKCHFCSQISKVMYEHPQELNTFIQTRIKPKGWIVRTIDHDGCQVLFMTNSKLKETMIAFRGTDFESWNDILVNLNYTPTPDPLLDLAFVHNGFLTELNSVWALLDEWIDEYARRDYHTITTMGHSLGGGLALLCGLRVAHRYDLLPCECYTFGAPMVGGPTFEIKYRQCLNFDHYRVTHNNDKVPRIATLYAMGYEHVGTPVHLTYNHELVIGRQSWKQLLWDALCGRLEAFKSFKWGDAFRDHRIVKYCQILEELKTASQNEHVYPIELQEIIVNP
jgi:predicted lipase